jgi:hypothetical protein
MVSSAASDVYKRQKSKSATQTESSTHNLVGKNAVFWLIFKNCAINERPCAIIDLISGFPSLSL